MQVAVPPARPAESFVVARVFVTRVLPDGALERLARAHDLTVWQGELPPPAEELRAGAAAAEGLLCLLTDRIDEAFLDAAPRLRAIANYAVGSDNIDLAAARARGIAVGVTPDVLTDATADLAFALILAAARRAAGFEMEVLTVGRDDDLHAALARADVVSLHVPLTPATHRLIDAAALAAMKPTAILVNTARGGLVDQCALAAALREGRIAAAALDVTDPEPLPPGDPLLSAPNLLVVPHIGSATRTARGRMTELAVDNLLAALDGRPMPHPA